MAEKDQDLPDFARIRLFVGEDLAPGRTLDLGAQASHYLSHVMRQRVGDRLRLFNGRDGEWTATIVEPSRKSVRVALGAQTRPQDGVPDLTLLFAALKKGPMGFLIEKATELGVARLQPVITARTQMRAAPERMRAHAIEAAEQSWRLSVPEIAPALALNAVLANWPEGAPILYCDERRTAAPALPALQDASGQKRLPWAILIGPEGGFDPAEQALLSSVANIIPVSLGPRIVRAETAAVMALTLWQSVLGDLAS
jgi:16S rRNA (uracil1498-N3)-methyltransferase